MENALKNCVMFFGAAIVGVIAIFVFFGAIMPVSQAHAYAIGSVPTNIGTRVGSSAGGGSYDFGSSFQNLVAPFTGFVKSLKFNNNTNMTMNPSGMSTGINGTSFTWPTVNLAPVLGNSVQNTLSRWFNQFDNWFYSVTGIQLSGIMVAILGVFSWALGLVQQVVNWLLGLFH
ncbi:MAG: hypothetical protein ABR884_04405 [Minisyncoccia bacterium]|jgi:hypothetical protein